MVRRLAFALATLISGTILGLLLVEAVLRCNPTLLPRGLAWPSPVDAPLTVQTYDVRYSDADAFYWRSDLIHPVPTSADIIESQVTYETDEYGFRNPGPLPPEVDVVVLGRSISLAGHLANPWPSLLKSRLSWQIFNLSQPGSGIRVKQTLLERYGLPRNPRWVIIEVVPSIDILGDHAIPSSVSQEVVTPVLQGLIRRWMPTKPLAATQAIYPLSVDLPGRTINLTCCLHYMDFFSLDKETLEASQGWINYRGELLEIVMEARSQGACVALLYVPTKPDVYFPLALHPEQLMPALREFDPLKLDYGGSIKRDEGRSFSVDQVRRNAFAGRDLVAGFAHENGLLWIDPNEALVRSVLDGRDPFMVYDSHWNQIGHEIVADTVATTLQGAPCP